MHNVQNLFIYVFYVPLTWKSSDTPLYTRAPYQIMFPNSFHLVFFFFFIFIYSVYQ